MPSAGFFVTLSPHARCPAPRRLQIHCVRAYGALLEALQRHDLPAPVVLHSWMGSAEMVTALLQVGGGGPSCLTGSPSRSRRRSALLVCSPPATALTAHAAAAHPAQLPNRPYFSLSGYLTKLSPGKAIAMVRLRCWRRQRTSGQGGACFPPAAVLAQGTRAPADALDPGANCRPRRSGSSLWTACCWRAMRLMARWRCQMPGSRHCLRCSACAQLSSDLGSARRRRWWLQRWKSWLRQRAGHGRRWRQPRAPTQRRCLTHGTGHVAAAAEAVQQQAEVQTSCLGAIAVIG